MKGHTMKANHCLALGAVDLCKCELNTQEEHASIAAEWLKMQLVAEKKKKKLALKGDSHQILLSEMSLPGVEVPIEKLLPRILGRLGKENPSKRQCKVAFVQRKCAVTSSILVRFLYATYY